MDLIDNIEKIHTTKLGIIRIQKNLGIEEDVVEYCTSLIKNQNCQIVRKGKNWYCELDDIIITVNAYSYTIITARRNVHK